MDLNDIASGNMLTEDDFEIEGLELENNSEVNDYDYNEEIDTEDIEHDDDENSESRPLASYIKSLLGGSEEILTGTSEMPLKYKIDDLSDAQLVSMLKYVDRQRERALEDEYRLNDDEQQIINLLRSKDYDSLNKIFSDEKIDIPNSLSDDEVILWKLKKDYPGLTQLELSEELDEIKLSYNYNTKLKSAKDDYKSFQEEYVTQQELNKEQQLREENETQIRTVTNIINDAISIYDLNIPEDVKKEASTLLNTKVNDYSDLSIFQSKYLSTPEGIAELAILTSITPKLISTLETLNEQNEILKAQLLKRSKPQSVTTKSVKATTQSTKQSSNNIFDDVIDLSTI